MNAYAWLLRPPANLPGPFHRWRAMVVVDERVVEFAAPILDTNRCPPFDPPWYPSGNTKDEWIEGPILDYAAKLTNVYTEVGFTLARPDPERFTVASFDSPWINAVSDAWHTYARTHLARLR